MFLKSRCPDTHNFNSLTWLSIYNLLKASNSYSESDSFEEGKVQCNEVLIWMENSPDWVIFMFNVSRTYFPSFILETAFVTACWLSFVTTSFWKGHILTYGANSFTTDTNSEAKWFFKVASPARVSTSLPLTSSCEWAFI